jgi:FKBP-type peptidyl-prolyl cis-trans isomerase FklB
MTLAQDNQAQNEKGVSKESIGYFLGLSVGQQMSSQGFKTGDFDVAELSRGLAEALAGVETKLKGEQLTEISNAIQDILQKRHDEMLAAAKKQGLLNKEKSTLYMEQNGKKAGVKKLESGVQYEVITSGTGASPSVDDTVSAHYTGRLTNGKVFDSSVERGMPMEFRISGVIKGWQDAIPRMKVGDKWRLHIPPDLAYGEQGVPGANPSNPVIGPNEVLVFEVELIAIK